MNRSRTRGRTRPELALLTVSAVLTISAALVGGLAGCATPSGPARAPGASMSTTPGPGLSGPSGSPSGAPSGTPASGAAGEEITLTGTVQSGVEGCLFLTSGGTVYALFGGDKSVIHDGAKVTVRGRPNPGQPNICMQGVPFQVREALPA